MWRLNTRLYCRQSRRAVHQQSAPLSTKGRRTKPGSRSPKREYKPRAIPQSTPRGTNSATATAPGHETADVIFKARKIPLLAAGVVALGCGLYLSLMVTSLVQQAEDVSPNTDTPTGRPPSFTIDSARQFDRSLDASEDAMGVTSLRQRLGSRASGHVLEVALGTGRNLAYYDWSILAPATPGDTSKAAHRLPAKQNQAHLTTFTGVDVSSDMLKVAAEKLPSKAPGLRGIAPDDAPADDQTTNREAQCSLSILGGKVRIAQCDIHADLPLPEPAVTTAQKYDTVVQTFGLCSVKDPGIVLRNLASVVQPGTGRIILVEHGRSSWGVVNTLLDWSAASHF
ncbi:methyltransferase OMS1, partial [Plectosphaerella plurivora]